MENVLLVSAMKEEVQGLLLALKEKDIPYEKEDVYSLGTIYRFSVGDNFCVATDFGISYFSIPHLTKVLHYHFLSKEGKPFESLILFGTCAGLLGQKIGEAFISNNCATTDLDLTFFGYIDGTLEKEKKDRIGPLMLSGSKFLNSKEEKERALKRFPGAVSFDMESYMVMRLAEEYNLPYLSMKAISDNGDEETANDFDKVVVEVAKQSALFVLNFLKNNTVISYIEDK